MDRKESGQEPSVNQPQLDYDRRYTYADYLTWDDDTRWELIDGVPYAMSAPTRLHQKIIGSLHFQLYAFLKGKPCEVYLSPFDVRLNADTRDDTVVQPDILVVCDQSILNKAGCAGVPDMLVEILSPSTSLYDRVTKFNRYLQAGVREYWIIDPEFKTLAVHLLKGEDYITRVFAAGDTAPVHVLEGCTIDLAEVFDD